MNQGPRIYNLFPLLVGPIEAWTPHLGRIAKMGFDWVFVNPFHETGFSGSLYAVKNHYTLNPLFRGDSHQSDSTLLSEFVQSAEAHGLSVMMDLVINHTAKDSVLVDQHPEWFARNPDGSLRSPGAVDPTDPTLFTEWGDLAEIDYGERTERAEIVAYWRRLVAHYLGLGFRGFRGDAAYKIPAVVWRDIIASARATNPDAVFFAETLGCRPHEVTALHEAGFDFIFNSSKWWDFKAPWLLEQYDIFRAIAPSISFPETHDTERLITDLEREGVIDQRHIEEVYRQRYLFSAVFATGVMIPMGFEFGFRRRLDVVNTRPTDWEQRAFDIGDFIGETNRMRSRIAVLNEEGPQSRLATDNPHVIALRRMANHGGAWTLSVINTDREQAHAVSVTSLMEMERLGCGQEATPIRYHNKLDERMDLRLYPSEIRIFACEETSEREGGTGASASVVRR